MSDTAILDVMGGGRWHQPFNREFAEDTLAKLRAMPDDLKLAVFPELAAEITTLRRAVEHLRADADTIKLGQALERLMVDAAGIDRSFWLRIYAVAGVKRPVESDITKSCALCDGAPCIHLARYDEAGVKRP